MMGFSASDEKLQQSMAFFGASSADIARWLPTNQQLHILPEFIRNAVTIFNAVQSQWRWSAGCIVGLDYAGVHGYLQISGKALSECDIYYLQRLERLIIEKITKQNPVEIHSIQT